MSVIFVLLATYKTGYEKIDRTGSGEGEAAESLWFGKAGANCHLTAEEGLVKRFWYARYMGMLLSLS